MTTAPWRDRALPASSRVDDLLARMTLEEKTAQLYGVWVGADTDGDGVAPHQHDMTADYEWDELITRGLGQLTRSFGTAPRLPRHSRFAWCLSCEARGRLFVRDRCVVCGEAA